MVVIQVSMSTFSLINKMDSLQEKVRNDENVPVFAKNIGTDYSYKHVVVWRNAIGILTFHLLGLWGLVVLVTGVSFKTFLWVFFVIYLGGQGITTGAHRYFTHKSYKATPLLKAILLALQTSTGQNSMFTWCRDHRLHHRYSDTDADPHNAMRGFFFSHVGWLMCKKHPLVLKLGRNIDLSDLQADWMVIFQKKYYIPLYLVLGLFIPFWVPIHYFGENWWNALLTTYFARNIVQLNVTWLVNSAAHIYGPRPYDRNIQPVESSIVSFLAFGEGWHNYHHAFPWDYKAAELSTHFNHSAAVIRFLEKIGLAYDLKTASPEVVGNRIVRTGDGSHCKISDYEEHATASAL